MDRIEQSAVLARWLSPQYFIVQRIILQIEGKFGLDYKVGHRSKLLLLWHT